MQNTTQSERDVSHVMNYITLTQTLVDSFYALADEVQSLTDRNIILEHKLQFAHEQYQQLADKYAPSAPDIPEILAKIQLPPDTHRSSLTQAKLVPLPKRTAASLDTRSQMALTIRDGRRIARELGTLLDPNKTSISSKDVLSRPTGDDTTMSTPLEQDFTIQGKKGLLQCPFSAKTPPQIVEPGETGAGNHAGQDQLDPAAPAAGEGPVDSTPHHSADPICAAMYEEAASQGGAPTVKDPASKCPIRYLDQHSPEEIAHYVETHKHELPRSHTVCVGRYQKNEDQVRKLDAKYGNLVSMIQGLSHLHQPMLPAAQREQQLQQAELDKASNQRVENWANGVTSSRSGEQGDVNGLSGDTEHEDEDSHQDEPERESHFDRPLKEVRVGESPSRPWGISVPVYETNGHNGHGHADGPPMSPPPAPVVMPSSSQDHQQQSPPAAKSGGGKCPFDHTKLSAMMNGERPPQFTAGHVENEGHGSRQAAEPQTPPPRQPSVPAVEHTPQPGPTPRQFQPQPQQQHQPPPQMSSQPAFINPPPRDPQTVKQTGSGSGGPPQMVFTGPVFIGYPIEQAIQFMQHFQGGQQQH